MSDPEEKREGLIPTQASALARSEPNSLAARARSHLRDKEEEAEEWLRKGLEFAGRAGKKFLWAKTDQERSDFDEAHRCFLRAYELDPSNAELVFNLAVSYRQLFDSQPEPDENAMADLRTSCRLFEQAAALGSADAEFDLGDQYCGKTFTCLDRVELNQGAKWYRAAAEKGHPIAQLSLAECYAYGGGVQQDDNEAIVWSRRALETGNEDGRRLYELLMSKPFPDLPFNSRGNYLAGWRGR